MHTFSRFVRVMGLAALMSAAIPAFAESAPVFDVDTFDAGGNDNQSQEYPMPPAPGEEQAVTHAAPPSSAPIAENSSAPRSAPAQASAPASQVASDGGGNVDTGPGVSVSTANLTPEQRMRRLEQQLNNLQNSEKASQVESLQNEVQSLRGQVEQLNHELDKLHSQSQSGDKLAGDTAATTESTTLADASKSQGAGASVAPAPVVKKSANAKKTASTEAAPTNRITTPADGSSKDQPNVAEEQKIYQTAYDYIKAKKYNEAVTTLQDMVKKYPTGQFASNAHYWLGELYGLMGKNDEALEEFNLVVNKFPGSSRVSDAQLKVGLILATQSRWADAKKAFKVVINTYPGTASARLASEQLKQIKSAGH